MPITIKSNLFKYKNPTTGQYQSIDAVAETTTSEQIAAIEATGTTVLNSIPADYTTMSTDVSGLKTKVGTVTLNTTNKDLSAATNELNGAISTIANAHYATLAGVVESGQLRAQKYLGVIVISGSVNVGSTGISGSLTAIATLADQEKPSLGGVVWGYGTYNGNVDFIQFELLTDGTLRSRHGSGTITGTIRFPNATVFG